MAKPKKRTGLKCGTCGKWHDELLTDVGARLPDEVWKLDYLTQYQRARYNADLYTKPAI